MSPPWLHCPQAYTIMHGCAATPPPVQTADRKMAALTSTRFNPGELDMRDTDLVLISNDNTQFYVHQHILLRDSSNQFGSLLPEPKWERDIEIEMFQFVNASELGVVSPGQIPMGYAADVLDILLRAIYSFSLRSSRPSPSTMRTVAAALVELGYDLHKFLAPRSGLFELFLQVATVEPLPMYALAAEHSLESLAVSISTLTLKVSPMGISDQLAEQMGAVYLRRLCCLHLDRTNSLKRLLSPPPTTHLPVLYSRCSLDARLTISEIWTFASSFAIFANHPNDLPRGLAPFIQELPCMRCRGVLRDRVQTLITDWSHLKSTI